MGGPSRRDVAPAPARPPGGVTGPSPATQLPMGVPSSSENVADVTRGSPGSNDHPVTQATRTRAVASDADAGTLITAPVARLAPALFAPTMPFAPSAPEGSPPSTHDTM